ncbi:TRAP transporter large permease subunit [Marinobacter sp. M3C]|uniref:TRAP transporter large permease n=1 Tax=unclassified Marinobacter TaxID=83889 RepID=UPI0020102BA3|nr:MULTISPECIES: TRAP transporter large permease subunit [unclassified Marinobacter]MCL1476854.1 TRAP transporter large permease subunit [Marinobacter sp.]MCL1481694.1 TRAP transporter large permease subunit [Marinobacter sp.]MCL1483499.1 TRAP transporter large permease subunit [Marinobacter sp.]UQG57631.1 TRAP transporter large permease subunit [Marinobacter sp. M4C]UQG61203.1 TRAP transporter large permease subunit [Marinobacter sp. M3C]
MEMIWMSLLLLVLLLALLGAGLWVAFSLTAIGCISLYFFSNVPVGDSLSTAFYSASVSWELAALPMFIWMGEVLFRSRLSEEMFSGISPWVGKVPGKLLHTNILGCGIFAAISGSSAATAATIGKMSIPELTRRGYNKNQILGTLAGSATLGLLIPPSIILIVYGVATEQSIARLFVAGILPGIMLMLLFSGYVMIWSLLNPDGIPTGEAEHLSFRAKLRRSRPLIPVMLLIIGVIGSIYGGLASPTESAAVGVALAHLLSWKGGSMSRDTFISGLMGTVKTSSMIAFILMGAHFLTTSMAFTGIPRELATWINTLDLSPNMLLLALTLFFILLGCFLDGISVVVLTTSVILPMVQAAGIDPLWFGIYLVIVVEMSQITPPVGFNLFVIQGLTGENILRIAWAALPYFLLILSAVVLITLFPAIVTYLPSQMGR